MNNLKKNKNKSKALASVLRIVLILVLIGVVIVAFEYRGHVEEEVEDQITTKYEEILAFDLENNYPQGPYEVLHNYYSIVEYLYGGECNEDEVPILIEKQRMLLSKNILEITPYDEQVENCKLVLRSLYENDQRILGVDQKMPVTDENNPNLSYCEVTEYYNNSTNSKIEYTLILEDTKWKILRWDKLNESTESTE